MLPNIIGYHANDRERIDKFISLNIPIFSNDTHWLGYGMYFWDNFSNAEYWKDQKFKKHSQICELAIIKVNIIIDEILDLTDLENAKLLDRLWSKYVEKTGKNENIPLGKKIDILFGLFPDLKRQYKVIKCFGKYKDELKNLEIFEDTRIMQGAKTIYCVRETKKIKNPVLYKEYKKHEWTNESFNGIG